MQKTMQNKWKVPAAMAISKEGYFKLEQGRYGPVVPRTRACHGVTIIAKIKPGCENNVRGYGETIEKAVVNGANPLATLKLHYLRWIIFNIGNDPHFMFQAIFDTDIDKYIEDGVAIFTRGGFTTVFVNLEGFPQDWKTNVPACIKYVRDHNFPSFLEYGEYPYVTADEIKKALKLKTAFGDMLDLMQ